MKKLVALALAAALGISTLLTGCGSSNNSTSQKNSSAKTSESQSAKQVTLRFSWWGYDSLHQATLNAIKLFEQKYPNIKIKAEYAGWNGYLDKQTTQIAGGTAADIMQINWNWIPIFSKDGNGFYDLNKLADVLHLKENYSDNYLKYGTVNGKLNAIPVSMTGRVIWFNKTIFDKYNVPIPKTWDDLISSGNKFPNGTYPMILGAYDAWLLSETYAVQMTGKPFIDGNGKLVFDENDIKIALQFYKKLLDNKVAPGLQMVVNEGGSSNPQINELPSFLEGKYAGFYQWTAAVAQEADPLKQKNMETVLGGIPIESGAKVSGAIFKPTLLFAINKDCKYPKEAATFLNFILNDPEGVKAMGLERGTPLSKSAVDALTKAGLLNGLEPEGLKFLYDHPSVPFSPYFEDPKLQSIYTSTMEQISYNRLSVDEAAKYMYENVQKTLSEIVK